MGNEAIALYFLNILNFQATLMSREFVELCCDQCGCLVMALSSEERKGCGRRRGLVSVYPI